MSKIKLRRGGYLETEGDIGGGGVKYDEEQLLTLIQQLRARANINAVGKVGNEIITGEKEFKIEDHPETSVYLGGHRGSIPFCVELREPSETEGKTNGSDISLDGYGIEIREWTNDIIDRTLQIYPDEIKFRPSKGGRILSITNNGIDFTGSDDEGYGETHYLRERIVIGHGRGEAILELPYESGQIARIEDIPIPEIPTDRGHTYVLKVVAGTPTWVAEA